MGAIQNSINQAMAAAGAAAVAGKRIAQADAALKNEADEKALKRAEAVKKVEKGMTEAALQPYEGHELLPGEAKKFATADYMGLKVNEQSDVGQRYKLAMNIKARDVLGSESYAKLMQDDQVLNRFAQVTGTQYGQDLLNEIFKGGNK